MNEQRCGDCGRPVVVAVIEGRKATRKAFNLPAVQGGRWFFDRTVEPPRMRHTPKPYKPVTAVGYTLHHCSTEPVESAVWARRSGETGGS